MDNNPVKEILHLKARAKINLTLDVVGKRSNGYHDVEMIMQQVSLYDEVTVKKRADGQIHLTCSEPYLPVDEQNIAYKAAKLMQSTYAITDGFDIHIVKKIPICAGLAGGSTDAAATLKAINQLCDLKLDMETLMTLGLKLGADVPFCLQEGAALAKGLGEELTEIEGLKGAFMLLVKPNFGVSTQEVYQTLKYQEVLDKPQTVDMLQAIKENKIQLVSKLLCNVLESVTIPMHPEVGQIKELLKCHGASGVLMSGSGPTVFGLFKNQERASKAYKKIKKTYPQTYLVVSHHKSKGV